MSDTTNIYFDFEFIDDGREIIPISVGMLCPEREGPPGVRPDNTLYLEYQFDPARANHWVREKVFPHLQVAAAVGSAGSTRVECARLIKEWVERVCAKHKTTPQFIGYYPSYDWVLLCQHFGTMMQTPKGWPMRPVCLRQLADTLGVESSAFPKQELEHHALADAKWNWDLHAFLDERHEGDAP